MAVPVPGALSSRIELSAEAYRGNVAAFRAVVGATRRVGAVLKGNAYGHGFSELLPLAHGSADVLYVVTPAEGLAVRAWEAAHGAPRREVLVIGALSSDEVVALAEAQVDVVVADRSIEGAVAALRARGLVARCHVHLDTGLGREGFTERQLDAGEADVLARARDVLQVAGVLSHFANTEDVTEQSYAATQLSAFERSAARLGERVPLPESVSRHFAASAAALVLPESRYDVVRVGIGLYGLWPSTETRLSARVVLGAVPTLSPVLSWRCPSQVVKWLPAGSYVGYGCTWRCGADTRVAVLPVGYWDGYPRIASGKAHVLVNGKRCAVLGRVMMNHLIVDVTHAVSSEAPLSATLLGRDGDEVLSVETLAGWAQTIHYEVLTRLGAHVPRVVVER
ncbi:MAG: alanine racemase [Myxococcaceae bacterium]|jgi:alanine racemase|nr:alanine racemase [Myxococcaceae bacterium]